VVAGSYFQAIRQKPFYKLPYLRRALEHCGSSKTAIIGDVWRWDLEYQIAHGKLSAREEKMTDPEGAVPIFSMTSSPDENCILLPRDAALHPQIIEKLNSA